MRNKKKELVKRIEKEKKSGKIVLLKDDLDDIFINFDINFTEKGEDILKKLATDERMINYNNLFLEQVILSLRAIIS